MVLEGEIAKSWDLSIKESASAMLPTLSFDDSNTFMCYASPLGVKIHNLKSNKLVRLVGRGELQERFLHVALF